MKALTGAYLLISLSVISSGCRTVTRLAGPQTVAVQLGVCSSPGRAEVLKKAGFSYVEGSVGRDLMPSKSDPDFLDKKRELDSCRLPILACNGFLPGSFRITGPDARHDTILRYAEVAFQRAASAGIRILVLGSAGARNIPEGFDRDQAKDQFVELLRKMGPLARKYGVVVAVENLQQSESNFINTVQEGLDIVRESNHPHIRLLADIFHMMRQNESPEVLARAGRYLVHCHIAELKDRTAPGMAGDDFRPYLSVLKKSGYRGAISIEGSWKEENLPVAYRVLTEQWQSIH